VADSCCEDKGDELAGLRDRQGRVLWIVLAVNAVLFVVEFGVGWMARSTALLGDSLDMLGDALVYAFSIWVLHRGARWRARASLCKGIVQLGFGLLVLGQAIGKLLTGLEVDAAAMGWMGAVALAGNGYCFYLLWSHRSDDLNMESTWLCSRNDLIANIGVLAAAAAVAVTGSGVPDIVVGLLIAALFLRTAVQIIAASRRELQIVGDLAAPAVAVGRRAGHAPTDD
jgi:Co/Zn/Cd efflux system component